MLKAELNSDEGERLIDSSRADERWGVKGTASASIAGRLTLEHIFHNYGDASVLNDVSMTVEPGEIVCLLGPSGCGKTTTLRIAAGIERQSSGRVLIDDRLVSDGVKKFMPPEKRSIGLMFQDYALFPHMTILANVAFGLEKLGKEDAKRTAIAALERVGLASYGDDYPFVLSGGQQQRVALARAIAPRPGILLMDEPFSGLDKRLRDNTREETLTILNETRSTCIMVTHQPEEALRMADRIAVMREGKIVQYGTARELYDNPKNVFVARMFSEINEISSKVTNGRVITPLGNFAADHLSEGSIATLCVRQQGLRLVKSGEGQPGRVLDVKFLGDAALLELAIEGLESSLLVRISDSIVPDIGSNLGVEVDGNCALVFPRHVDTGRA